MKAKQEAAAPATEPPAAGAGGAAANADVTPPVAGDSPLSSDVMTAPGELKTGGNGDNEDGKKCGETSETKKEELQEPPSPLVHQELEKPARSAKRSLPPRPTSPLAAVVAVNVNGIERGSGVGDDGGDQESRESAMSGWR